MRATVPRSGPGRRSEGRVRWSEPSRNVSLPPRQHTVEIGVRRRHVVEARVELARLRADVFLEVAGIEDLRQPAQPDQAVDRGRKIDPAKRHFRRQMHAAGTYGRDVLPEWIAANT